jgi:hypothetical protein
MRGCGFWLVIACSMCATLVGCSGGGGDTLPSTAVPGADVLVALDTEGVVTTVSVDALDESTLDAIMALAETATSATEAVQAINAAYDDVVSVFEGPPPAGSVYTVQMRRSMTWGEIKHIFLQH